MAGPGVDICNTIGGDIAPTLVADAWDTFQGFAGQAYQLALDQTYALNNFQIQFHDWDASFSVDDTLSGFHRPDRPVLPTITQVDLSGEIPDAPTLNIPVLTVGLAPAEPADLLNPPSIDVTVNAPDALPDRPDTAPTLNIPDAPTAPTITDRAEPTLIEPTLPTVPTITIEEFLDEVPEFTATPPSEQITFVETPYVSTMLTAVQSHLQTMLDGQVLPPEVEDALWGRQLDRQDQADLQALQTVREEFAARGWGPEPNGLMGKRLQQVTQESRKAKSGASRDIYIQNQQIAIENTRFAVTQGIALEGTLIQMHMQVQQRKFDLAIKLKDVAIAVFQAQVAQYNAVVQAFNARIAAYQAFLDGQRARVDVYSAQVGAAKVESEINTQRVQAFTALVQADGVKADIYKAQVDGFRSVIEAEKARIEAYGEEVNAYSALVGAYKAQWEGEKTRIEAEAMRGELYKTMVEAYATRVDVYKTQSDVNIAAHRENLVGAQMLMQQHEAQVKTVLGKLEAVRTLIQAQSAQSDSVARMYQADAALESTAVDADTRAFNAMVASEQTRVDLILKDAQLQISQLNQRASLLLRAAESSAAAASQLAASAMSAVNFSAGVSSGHSNSQSCSTSFSYSGEILDAS